MKKVRLVISFYDGINPEPYDGTEMETTENVLNDMCCNPQDYNYDSFYVNDVKGNTYYCIAFQDLNDPDYEELFDDEIELQCEF